MTATGHSPIKAKLAETGAPLAGEMSGHIFYADGYYGFDDAVYVAVRLLGILGRSSESLVAMRDRLPHVVNTPELRFPCGESRKFEVVREVGERLAASRSRDDRDRRRARAHCRRVVAATRLEYRRDVLVARAKSTTADGLARLTAELSAQLADSGVALPDS